MIWQVKLPLSVSERAWVEFFEPTKCCNGTFAGTTVNSFRYDMIRIKRSQYISFFLTIGH